MTNDRFGIRWGLAGGTTLASLSEAREAARFAANHYFDSFWISHAMGVDPILTLACIGPEFPTIGEMGTSETPLFGRHPIGLAQLTRTAQNALDGRFTLGIGAASRRHAEEVLGMSWAKRMIFTGEHITADKALEIGLVEEIVSLNTLNDRAAQLAAMIANNAPVSIELSKKVLNRVSLNELETALAFETEAVSYTHLTLPTNREV